MKAYDTMSAAITDLIKRGYIHDFNLKEECLFCAKEDKQLRSDEFEIDEIYRFEGDTDPGDENIVYAISSSVHGLKGILVNAYGPYADSISADLVSKLNIHPN